MAAYGDETMRKNFLFLSILIFLLLFSYPVSAFTDTVGRYETDYTDFYTVSLSKNNQYATASYTIAVSSDPRGLTENEVIFLKTSAAKRYNSVTAITYLTPKEASSPEYFSFILTGEGYGGYYADSSSVETLLLKVSTEADSTVLTSFTITPSEYTISDEGLKIEIIQSGLYYNVYINGNLEQSKLSSIPDYTGDVFFSIGNQVTTNAGDYKNTDYILYLDDITDSSCIGTQDVITEADDNSFFTWSSKLMRSYETQQKVTLYSLTNLNNTGEVTFWNVPQSDDTSTPEHGYLNFSRVDTLGDNYGIYMLELTRGSSILADQYFYYSQLSEGASLPEVLFLAETSVKADIRDDDNNGKEVLGGGSVYLYPTTQDDGTYNITFDISETPYNINTELTKIYNTTTLNETNISFSGLSGQNYFVSVDGTQIASTNGSDTWNYSVSWNSQDSHSITFAPDYTLPGVWGYVKNSETQDAIKSATVSIKGNLTTNSLYTDDNGIYYYTLGMEAGQTYNVTASKTGYAAANPALVTTTEGATTRNDFYLDPASGEGIYYAPHSVTFTILENWYNYTGLPGVPYSVYDNIMDEEIKTGSTDSKGQFTVKEMDGGTNYTITFSYNGRNITEYVEPGLSEYTFVLNEEGTVHTYFNNWLSLTYSQNSTNATVTYSSNKTLSGAYLIATASNGTITYNQVLTTQNGSFYVPFSPGDYSLQFHIEASDGSEASQVWTITNPATVNLFPISYPAWLKNTLFTAVILIFLLAFGKSKNDIACGSVAVLTSLGYFFKWLTCSFNFVVLVWIIAAGAIYLHYKRTGAVG